MQQGSASTCEHGSMFWSRALSPCWRSFCRSKQGGSPGAYDRSFRWKYHQFRFLCHVSSAAKGC